MKNKLIIIFSIVFVLVIGACLAVFIPKQSPPADEHITNIGIGGGGAFFNPLVDPTNQNNIYVTSDMGAIYYSHNKGESWNRTETKGVFKYATIAHNGNIFAGGYGLYASYNQGKDFSLIYPKNVVYSISRCGWNENLMIADGFDNGYLVSVKTDTSKVYFTTVSWYGELKIMQCNYSGDELVELYTKQLGDVTPHDVDIYMQVANNNLYFSLNGNICCINLSTKQLSNVYTSKGKIKDFEIIGDKFFIIDDQQNESEILYTSNFENFDDLLDYNNLSNQFYKWNQNLTFNWHFNHIAGNNFDNIFLAF